MHKDDTSQMMQEKKIEQTSNPRISGDNNNDNRRKILTA